ncbi:hypothetical protein TPHA_0B00170 [Tetrapisispora phaffii CBS 4417]|uniref:Enoyl reductase (ER) domain-containing protein n=1 Tax=Tetrapisispora phaffii (strain ATCC 24235 / CBS 4417 / NBRC 1672 / NRRL Y-8282 / UCD 70-5) TaxID=1071381 RepID=G8BQ92_TETPH|nr:hypothetical protein TPHA_0B00170 [Tetrapisispora phaffii CBS 4417]CCE61689.1 hypothetical protein TPHA_0B00170 [Tetrapisispora phaffii CBS 4417]
MSIVNKIMFWKSSKKEESKKATQNASTQKTAKKATQTKPEMPSTMKAVVIEESKPVVKSDIPVPELEEGFALIKVLAVAGNPTDWKHIAYKIGPQGAILGCDAAGEIVKLGAGVDTEKFKVGDKVYGFIHGASVKHPENGAFAEYAAIDTKICYRPAKDISLAKKDLPAGPVTTLEGAVSFPVSLTTAGLALTNTFKVKLQWEPAEAQLKTDLLIWGGATALGQPLIQLAKKLNAFNNIVVVASKKHEEQLKAYGATEVFDYHDEDVISQITTKYPNVTKLVDAVSNKETINQLYQCASKTEESTLLQLVTLSIDDIEEANRRDNVKIVGFLLYSATGKEVPFLHMVIPPLPDFRKDAIEFIEFINEKINNGEIHHIPIKVFQKGLEDVPGMLADIEAGKNSGEKYVAVL